jgi:hypothetical protein
MYNCAPIGILHFDNEMKLNAIIGVAEQEFAVFSYSVNITVASEAMPFADAIK